MDKFISRILQYFSICLIYGGTFAKCEIHIHLSVSKPLINKINVFRLASNVYRMGGKTLILLFFHHSSTHFTLRSFSAKKKRLLLSSRAIEIFNSDKLAQHTHLSSSISFRLFSSFAAPCAFSLYLSCLFYFH